MATTRIGRKPLILELYGDETKQNLRVYAAYGRKRAWYTASPQFFDEADALFGRLKAGLAFGGGGRGITAKLIGRDRVRLTGGVFGEGTDLSFSSQRGSGLTVLVITLAGLLLAGVVGATMGSTGGAAKGRVVDYVSEDDGDDRDDADDDEAGEDEGR
ncbi:MAG: hypothetical protein AAF830_12485 [Pseudomonadota bacterium]